MNIPVLVLLAFAVWIAGRASIAEWRADVTQGSDWHQRALRAHMNCIENFPVYAAIVVALLAAGLQSPVIDRLALIMLMARMGQTVTHISLPPSNTAASLRFSLFFVQLVCMFTMCIMATRI